MIYPITADPRGRLESVRPDLRLIHARATALRVYVEQLQRPLFFEAAFAGTADLVNIENNVSFCHGTATSPAMQNLLGGKELLRLLEASDVFHEAAAIIDPLLALCAADVAEDQAAAKAAADARVALAAAEEAAREKLLAKVESDPAVAKARAALDAIKL